MLSKKERRNNIEIFAKTIHETLNLPQPVSLEAVIKSLEGDWEFYSSEFGQGARAYIRKKDDAFAIAFIEPMVIEEWRFLVAVQLGHLFMHLGYCLKEELWESIDVYRDSVLHRMGYMEEKYEAECFARSFLMPKDIFSEVASSNIDPTSGYYLVGKIASHFNVPKNQVRKRGIELFIFEKPCLFRA